VLEFLGQYNLTLRKVTLLLSQRFFSRKRRLQFCSQCLTLSLIARIASNRSPRGKFEMWILAQRWNCSLGYPPYCRKVEKRVKKEALLAPLIRTSLRGCAYRHPFTAPESRLFKSAHKMKIS
jgi:hypothetical protein